MNKDSETYVLLRRALAQAKMRFDDNLIEWPGWNYTVERAMRNAHASADTQAIERVAKLILPEELALGLSEDADQLREKMKNAPRLLEEVDRHDFIDIDESLRLLAEMGQIVGTPRSHSFDWYDEWRELHERLREYVNVHVGVG